MNFIRLKIVLYSCLLFIGCKTSNLDKQPKSPIALSVEYIRRPEHVLIIDNKPEFAWEVPNVAISQSAYQILVASSKENIENDKADIWNSGKVLTNQSINVEFKGSLLEVGNTYFWKVKIWNEEGKESAFSKAQRFTIGAKKNIITSANSFQTEAIKPKVFKSTGEGTYFIDFGKAAFANMEFSYKTEQEDTLIVHIGEQLINDKINREPKGTIRYQKIKVPVNPNKTKYGLNIKPDKRNTKPEAIKLPDSFPVLLPFRYVEIEGVKNEIKSEDFTQLFYHSYWDDNASYFKSSDTLLNQIWDLCKYSIKATTFAGVYVDGDRERIPYEADAYLNQLSHYTTDAAYAMARQTIEYFMKHPTWPTEWQLHVALMFHADYMYTGNTELIETYYEALKHKTLLELRREDGLISSKKATPEFMKKLGFKNPKDRLKDIVDWPPAQKDASWWKLATKEGERDGFVFKPINTVVNCFYYKNLLIMKDFAKVIGNTKDVKFFNDLSKQVKTSINTKLFDNERRIYVDGEGTNHAALHTNMLALAFDIVPEDYVESVAEYIKSRGMACSVYGAQYLLEALYKANESEFALDLITAKHDRSWYNMMKVGSTITLEAWDMKYKPNSDWNHAWGAAPANIIPRYLWGIQPKTPGYEVAVINPQMGSLTSSSIEVPTIRGQIKANYILENNTKTYTIEIPANMEADFEVASTSKVKVNNEKVSTNNGVINLKPGKYFVEVL